MVQAIPVEPLSYTCLDPRRVRRGLAKGTAIAPEDLLGTIEIQLGERLDEILITPTCILELSRRPGHFATLLQHRLPKSTLVSFGLVAPLPEFTPRFRLPWQRYPLALAGNPTHLPFAGNQFDVILSNMTLQWCLDPMAALKEMRRVLKPGGLLLLSTPGEKTLDELRKSLAQIDQTRFGRAWTRIQEFPSPHRLGDMLTGSGFVRCVIDRDLIRPSLADTPTLLTELRRIGGVNAHRQRPSGLMGKGYLDQLANGYQANFGQTDGSIPVTIELLFGHGWKADSHPKNTSPLPNHEK